MKRLASAALIGMLVAGAPALADLSSGYVTQTEEDKAEERAEEAKRQRCLRAFDTAPVWSAGSPNRKRYVILNGGVVKQIYKAGATRCKYYDGGTDVGVRGEVFLGRQTNGGQSYRRIRIAKREGNELILYHSANYLGSENRITRSVLGTYQRSLNGGRRNPL
jgi:hypothetical protein